MWSILLCKLLLGPLEGTVTPKTGKSPLDVCRGVVFQRSDADSGKVSKTWSGYSPDRVFESIANSFDHLNTYICIPLL